METPETVGGILEAIEERFGTREPQTLARLSGVSRTTLLKWKARPSIVPKEQSRAHYRRIFGEERPAPDLTAIDARLARIEQRLDDARPRAAQRPRPASRASFSAARWHGGGVPTGYLYDRDKKTIVPDPARVEEVRLLLQGALTRGARSLRDQFPAWSPTAIQRALSRQRVWWYAGRVLLEDGTTIAGAWEPIITEDQARALQAARERKKLVRHGTKSGRKRLLTGLGIFVCGHCGTSMKSLNNSSTHGGIRREYLYYRCNPWWVKGSASDCPNRRGIPCNDLDGAVLAAVWGEMPALVAAAADADASGGAALPSPLEVELVDAKARRDRLVGAVEDGTLTPGEARDRLLEARKRIAKVTAELERAQPAPLVITDELQEMIARTPKRVPVTAARALLALVVERIELHDREELRIRMKGGREIVRRWR